MARVVRRGRPGPAERLGDLLRRVLHQFAGAISGASAPWRQSSDISHVRRHKTSRKLADLVGRGGHALKVGERARRGVAGAEQADDGLDFASVESRVQAGLEEAPVPVLRRCGEQQHEEVAFREDAADLAPPVLARRDVDAGYEAFDALLVRPWMAFFTSTASA